MKSIKTLASSLAILLLLSCNDDSGIDLQSGVWYQNSGGSARIEYSFSEHNTFERRHIILNNNNIHDVLGYVRKCEGNYFVVNNTIVFSDINRFEIDGDAKYVDESELKLFGRYSESFIMSYDFELATLLAIKNKNCERDFWLVDCVGTLGYNLF